MAKVPIGLQLYSVRKDCEENLPHVIEFSRKNGICRRGVCGILWRTAAELKRLLDDNGIVCCGTHTPIDTILGDSLKATSNTTKHWAILT